MVVINLITPKVGAEHELLLNKLASVQGLLNKSSCLASALGVTKITNVRDIVSITLCFSA
jgi:hypothetical protein